MPKLYNPKTIINNIDNTSNFSFRTNSSATNLPKKIPPSSSSNRIINSLGNKKNIGRINNNNNRIKNLILRVKKNKKIKNNKNSTTTTSTTNTLVSVDKSNSIAKSLGFKNAADFDNFIKDINLNKLSVTETKKLSRLFHYLSKVAKKNPKGIAKLAIVGGSLTAMIVFLKKFQNEHSGCFRYGRNNDESDNIKYKFAGSSWCNTNGSSSSSNGGDDKIKLLPESEHPLYNRIKWDCNYNNFKKNDDDDDQALVDKILEMGCNGLCDWKHFNFLAKKTRGEYTPIISKDLVNNNNEHFFKYIYKCETINMLQALSISTTNTLSDLIGLNVSNGIVLIKQLFLVFIFLILIYKMYFNLKGKRKQQQ